MSQARLQMPTPPVRTTSRRRVRASQRAVASAWVVQGYVGALVAAWAVLDSNLGVRQGGAVALITAFTMGNAIRLGLSESLIIGFLGLAAASHLWSVSPNATGENLKYVLGLTGLVIGMRAICSTPQNVRRVALGYLAACLYSGFSLWRGRGLSAGALQFLPQERSSLEGIEANFTAYAIATGAVVAMLAFHKVGTKPRLLLVIASVSLGTLGLLPTGTRGALAAIAALVAWQVAARIAPRISFTALIWASPVVLLLIASGVLDEALTPNREEGRETGDLNGRLRLWRHARWLIADRPFSGHGAGTYVELSPANAAAHNGVLELGVGLGVVGIALWFAAIYSLLLRDTRKSLPERDRAWLVGGMIALTTPILASGVWELSGPMWIAFVLISRLGMAGVGVGPGTTRNNRLVRTGTSGRAEPQRGDQP